MVSIIHRMRKLRAKLLALRLGPGAALLPKDVKRIHLDFAHRLNDGNFGPRKFWRTCLPRLKYHNPAVSMTINRTKDQYGPATLTVYFALTSDSASPTASPAPTSSTSTSTAPSEHTPADRVESVDIKHKHESQILAQLMELTNAEAVVATPEEEEQLRQIEEENRKSAEDAQRSAEVNERRRKEAALLDRARGMAAESTA